MGAPLTSCVLLLVAVIAGAQASIHRRQICMYIADMCGSELQSVTENFYGQAQDVERICQLSTEARRCMGGCLSVLLESGPMARALVQVMDYLCDEDRREQIAAVFTAACFTDGSLEQRFEQESQMCTQNITQNIEQRLLSAAISGNLNMENAMCPVVDDVIECVNGKAEELCGEEVVPVFHDIITITLREMLIEQIPSCFDQAHTPHIVVKRAVELLKTLRK